MKKIMIAIGIALAAAVTQAAAINWQISAGPAAKRVLDYTGSAAFKGTAYLILTSDAESFMTQLAKDGTIGSLTTYGSTSTFNATTGGMSAALKSSDTLGTSETAFSVLLVQTVGDNTYYKVSTSQSETPSADLEGNPVTLAWTAQTTLNTQTWQTYSVPEPTSGILLLLGMAGLALKRKNS